MEFGLHAFVLTALAAVCAIPYLRKPLSEDDGRWFYYAAFRHKGVAPYLERFHITGYYGIEWLSALASRAFGRTDARFFHAIKWGWYWLTALSLYGLVIAYSGTPILALAAGVLFLVAASVPSTKFFLTYGEHVFLLPMNLALVAALYAFEGGWGGWGFVAGLLACWMFHVKITALVFATALGAAMLFTPHPIATAGGYAFGFVLLTILPVVHLYRHGKRPMREYFESNLEPFVSTLEMLAGRYAPQWAHKALRRLGGTLFRETGVDFDANYVGTNHKRTKTSRMDALWTNVRKPVRDLWPLLVLTCGEMLTLPWTGSVLGGVMVGVLAAMLATQYLQQNYYMPHFNPVWVPLSVLAASAGVRLAGSGWFGMLLLGVLGGWQAVRWAWLLLREYRPEARDHVDGMESLGGVLFRLAETMGKDIASRADDDDTLFVWGDIPSVYVYSGLKAANAAQFFMYGFAGRLRSPFGALMTVRTLTPEWVQFFNFKVSDEWTMDTLTARTGFRYDRVTSFQALDSHGRSLLDDSAGDPVEFPLYRRDDEFYAAALVERACEALAIGDTERASGYLDRALKAVPDHAEARLLAELAACEPAQRLALVNRHMRKPDADKAMLMRHLARELAAAGKADAAQDMARAAVAKAPGDAAALKVLADLRLAAGARDEAFMLLKRAYEANPLSPSVLFALGGLMTDSGFAEQGRELLSRAATMHPKHPLAEAFRQSENATDQGDPTPARAANA